MPILPTWDLFIVVFFAIIVAYSFIIGRDATLKIIISSYIAILAADGLGNLFNYFFLTDKFSPALFYTSNPDSLIILKILIFVCAIVLLTIRGQFVVTTGRESSWLIRLALTGSFGFLSAGLIVATILVYISGGSFLAEAPVQTGMDIVSSSPLARLMTENYNLWFALPAIAFVLASLTGPNSKLQATGE